MAGSDTIRFVVLFLVVVAYIELRGATSGSADTKTRRLLAEMSQKISELQTSVPSPGQSIAPLTPKTSGMEFTLPPRPTYPKAAQGPGSRDGKKQKREEGAPRSPSQEAYEPSPAALRERWGVMRPSGSKCPFALEEYNYGWGCDPLAVNPRQSLPTRSPFASPDDELPKNNCTLRNAVLKGHEAKDFCLYYHSKKRNIRRTNCYITEIVQQIFFPEEDGEAPERPDIVEPRPHRFFIEIGALDGLDGSNTHFFQAKKKWEGLLVEGSHKYWREAKKNRVRHHTPEVRVLHAVACNAEAVRKKQYLAFYDGAGKGMTGLVDAYSEKFAETRLGGAKYVKPTSQVRCVSLSEQVSLMNRSHVDFWSLDVEGAELDALSAFNFTEVTVGLIAIELDGTSEAKDYKCRKVLQERGFIKFLKSEDDEFWFHPKYAAPQGPWAPCFKKETVTRRQRLSGQHKTSQ